MKLRLTPDGKRYLAMGRGEAQPVPFHLRWLMPAVCGENEYRWFGINTLAIVVLPLLTAALALQHGATQTQAAVAALLFAGLPSLRFAWGAPILIDMPALALALGAAVAFPWNYHVAAVLVVLAAATSEKAPIWAAIFAWEPMMLGALSVPIMRRLLFKPGEISPRDPLAWTFKPLLAGQRGHAGHWRDWRLMVAPWGVCLVVLTDPSLWVATAFVAGYALLLVATDSVRLYQQAAPVVCVAAAMTIPAAWAVPVLLAHWFNPWMGDGL